MNDNSSLTNDEVQEVPRLVKTLADKTLQDLDAEGVFVFPDAVRDSDDLESNQFVLCRSRNMYRTGNVMGFLGLGTERLVIKSRFSNQIEDYFFQYLLNRAMGALNLVHLNFNLDNENHVFQYLLFLFPRYLTQAMRKGLYKEYASYKRNRGDVKGSIDIARHIKDNTPFIGNVAFNERQFSYNNSLVQLVRHTIEFIKLKPNGKNLLTQAKDEVDLIRAATDPYRVYDRSRIIRENSKNPVRHAYFREYYKLQKLCLLILRHRQHYLGSGVNEIFGILFDGAWLWEEYVGSLIGDLFYHPQNKRGKGRQYLFDGNAGWIYPDFISKDSKNRVIADAKYKPIENIGNSDYLQLVAYMYRFDSPKGLYLYPEARSKAGPRLRLNQGSSYEGNVQPRDNTFILKHGLRIPQFAPDYGSFVEELKVNEREFIDGLTS